MEKETGASKCDPYREIVQMRAQWKKADICMRQWVERWSWLAEEQRNTAREINDIKRGLGATLPHLETEEKPRKSLKPVPVTSTGVIGWLASKPEHNLDIYGSWMDKPPIRLPDAWDHMDRIGQPQQ